MDKVRVELAGRGYDILVGTRLLADAGSHIAPLLQNARAIVVSDENVAKLYLHRLTGALEESGIATRAVIVPPGEESKSLARFPALLEELLEQKPERGTMLIALGGGVAGDLAGFAASVLLRGLDFIQIPTTLLSQVDSSVGGKTGVNSRLGKNLVGSFHQPKLVLADVSLLATLPKRQMLAGYAETLKYGLIGDAAFFGWLEQNGAKLLAGDEALLARAVVTGCTAKAAIVSADEKETGARALLNLGHTFAHALEAETGYSDTLLHGEAVAIGMALAFAASVEMGICPQADLDRLLKHYQAVGLPALPPKGLSAAKLSAHFTRDKKAKGGRPVFILVRGIGQAFIAHDADTAAVERVLARATASV